MPTKQELVDKSDNYQQTLFSLLALQQHFEYEYDGNLDIGRQMTPSEENKVQEEDDITPDGVSLLDEDYGVVVEVKKSIPQPDVGREKILKQLLKYDDSLEGWWGEGPIEHDIICITHQTNARPLSDFKDDYEGEETIDDIDVEFDRPAVVCGFVRSDGSDEYLLFQKVRDGRDLRNNSLDDRLDEGLAIAMKYFIEKYQSRRFSDDKPPMPYLLSTLWDYVFSSMIATEKFNTSRGGQSTITVEGTVEEITEYTRKFYGCNNGDNRSPNTPKESWIREALRCLEEMGHAELKDDETGKYEIQYRKLPVAKNNMMSYFAEELSSEEQNLEQFLEV